MSTIRKHIGISRVTSSIKQSKIQKVTCAICKGVCFDILQCKRCHKSFCKSHDELIDIDRTIKCLYCKGIFEEKANSQIRGILQTIQINCKCQGEIQKYNYQNYKYHIKQCKKQPFKQFYFVYPNGIEIQFNQKDNVLTNINLNSQKYQISITNYMVYLKTSKCVDKLFMGDSQAQVQYPILDITFKYAKNRQQHIYWLFEGNNNGAFEMYDDQYQTIIQQAYQQYKATGHKLQLQINSKTYILDFEQKKQYVANNESIPRQIKRIEI